MYWSHKNRTLALITITTILKIQSVGKIETFLKIPFSSSNGIVPLIFFFFLGYLALSFSHSFHHLEHISYYLCRNLFKIKWHDKVPEEEQGQRNYVLQCWLNRIGKLHKCSSHNRHTFMWLYVKEDRKATLPDKAGWERKYPEQARLCCINTWTPQF